MPSDPASSLPPAFVPEATHLQMPVSIRSLSLAIIALVVGLFVLHWVKAVFIPFMLGLIFSYALLPIVN